MPHGFGHLPRPADPAAPSWLGHVPVMPVTVLALDLLLQEPSIDLNTLSGLVLSDVGATLHLFRLIGQECASGYASPRRMNECLAVLDIDSWFSSLSAHAAVSHSQHHQAIAALWKHSHLIAQCTEWIAGALDGIASESAYLIGLLHEAGAIAGVLGLPNAHSSGDVLASIGGVPGFVCDALKDTGSGAAAFWSAVLKVAHDLAAGRSSANAAILDLAEVGRIRDRILSELSIAQAC